MTISKKKVDWLVLQNASISTYPKTVIIIYYPNICLGIDKTSEKNRRYRNKSSCHNIFQEDYIKHTPQRFYFGECCRKLYNKRNKMTYWGSGRTVDQICPASYFCK